MDLDGGAFGPPYPSRISKIQVQLFFLDNNSIRVKYVDREDANRFEVPFIINEPLEIASVEVHTENVYSFCSLRRQVRQPGDSKEKKILTSCTFNQKNHRAKILDLIAYES